MKKVLPCLLFLLIGAAIGYFAHKTPKVNTVIKTITDTLVVEHTDTMPIVKTEKVLKYVYVGGDTIYGSDTIIVRDSIPVPITQKEYQDSLYHAWVSGYLPNLDSIKVKERTITNTVTITNTIKRKWNIGVTGGYGYGFVSGKLEPFIGVGVSYNLR